MFDGETVNVGVIVPERLFVLSIIKCFFDIVSNCFGFQVAYFHFIVQKPYLFGSSGDRFRGSEATALVCFVDWMLSLGQIVTLMQGG